MGNQATIKQYGLKMGKAFSVYWIVALVISMAVLVPVSLYMIVIGNPFAGLRMLSVALLFFGLVMTVVRDWADKLVGDTELVDIEVDGVLSKRKLYYKKYVLTNRFWFVETRLYIVGAVVFVLSYLKYMYNLIF